MTRPRRPKAETADAAEGRTVLLPGLRGTITMRPMTAREFVAIRKQELSDVEAIDLVIGAIVEYLPGRDPLDMPLEDVFELLGAWMAARR